MALLMRELVNRSYYYLSFLFILGLTLSLTLTPSFISAPKSQFALAQPLASDAGGKRPNILLIMGDDFGFSDIASFGSEIPTPNIDTISKEGKILTNYHTGPVCSPARVAFLTGVDNHIGGIGTMYENIAPNQIGKPGYETYINDKVVTVQELLRDGIFLEMGYKMVQVHIRGDLKMFSRYLQVELSILMVALKPQVLFRFSCVMTR
jgi:hypothetical protein